MLKNSYGGIGSVITWNPKLKRSMISEPYENMPAADVGTKAGDILMEIDGKDLAGKNNQEVSEMLRGQVGTSFKLKVQRPVQRNRWISTLCAVPSNCRSYLIIRCWIII